MGKYRISFEVEFHEENAPTIEEIEHELTREWYCKNLVVKALPYEPVETLESKRQRALKKKAEICIETHIADCPKCVIKRIVNNKPSKDWTPAQIDAILAIEIK